MTRGLIVLAIVGAVAIGSGASTSLPYYDSSELTPRWHDVDHRVAPFEMTTQTGDALRSTDLGGRVYIASFIYTRCGLICPTLVANLRRAESAIADKRLLILSFTVTPDTDSPAVLADFGRERSIDPAGWKLLTGPKDTIYRLARDSYFADDARLAETGPNDFLHTEKLVLVDGAGKLRGVYNGTQPADIEHLVTDAKVLLKSGSGVISR
jgi:protein SCO1/2